jgi:histidine phosphotransfer protein HptB
MADKPLFEKHGYHQNGTMPQNKVLLKDFFDKAGLLDRVMGDEELAIKFFNEFLKDFPSKFTALKEAFEERDAVLVHRIAHTLNGSSANIGALTLQDIASQIELAAKSGYLDKAGPLIPRIKEQFEVLGKLNFEDITVL